MNELVTRLKKLKSLKRWDVIAHQARNTIYLLYPKKDRALATPYAQAIRKELSYYNLIPPGIRIRSAALGTTFD